MSSNKSVFPTLSKKPLTKLKDPANDQLNASPLTVGISHKN